MLTSANCLKLFSKWRELSSESVLIVWRMNVVIAFIILLMTLTLQAPGILAGVAPGGGGVFSTSLHNSFVFKVKLLKFSTELLWDKMNILGQRESGSNRQ